MGEGVREGRTREINIDQSICHRMRKIERERKRERTTSKNTEHTHANETKKEKKDKKQ